MPRADLITRLATNEGIPPEDWLRRLWESPRVDKYLQALARELDCDQKTAKMYLVRFKLVSQEERGLYQRKPEDTNRGAKILKSILAQGYPPGTTFETYLRTMTERGFGSYRIAELLNCSPRTVRNQAHILGLNLPTRTTFDQRRPPKGYLPSPPGVEDKRRNAAKRYTTTDGRTFTLREISEKTGVTYLAVLYRIRNWGIDRAVNAEKKACQS